MVKSIGLAIEKNPSLCIILSLQKPHGNLRTSHRPPAVIPYQSSHAWKGVRAGMARNLFRGYTIFSKHTS